MLIYKKRVYHGIMYLQASSVKSVNYHFSAKFIIFVALSNTLYISR